MGIHSDIDKVLSYLEESEQKHYEESEEIEKENHIYKVVQNVRDWFESPSCCLVPDDELEEEDEE